MPEIAERMVEIARGRGLDAQVGDVQSLAFDDSTFRLGTLAASTRMSTRTGFSAPTLSTTPTASTRSSLPCSQWGI